MLNEINIPKNTIPSTLIQQKKNRNNQNNPNFTSINLADGFVKSQENLKVTRFFQDVSTNWVPKAVFSRSLPDFAEMSFLEYTESALFYFVPTWFGNFFKKAYAKIHPEKLRKDIASNIGKSAEEILKDKKLEKDDVGKRILSTKAAIILGCTAIPAGEYALSFAKNLFTLKLFKKSDFNNVVNLNKGKDQVEHKEHQDKVRNSAIKHIEHAGILALGGLGASLVLVKYGHKSEALQKLSSIVLQPGAHIAKGLNKIGLIKTEGHVEKFLKKYITPDFAGIDGNDKFLLSKGQLLVSTVSGFFGYSEAGKDRGKLDQYEVWTRVPFVVLYTVFGSALFDNLFNKVLIKKGIFPDVIGTDAKTKATIVKTRNGIKRVAVKKVADKTAEIKKLRTAGNISKEEIKKLINAKKLARNIEFNKLIKQKAIIAGVPYLFSLVFMGFLLAGITRFWTQYRFNRLHKAENKGAEKAKTETQNWQIPEKNRIKI